MRRGRLVMDRERRMTPLATEESAPERGKPLVVLVHGFNNNHREAGESFYAMRRNLDNSFALCGIDTVRRQSFQSQIWEFYWPGYQPLHPEESPDAVRPGFKMSVSALSYSMEVGKARDWVPKGLAKYLREVEPSSVFFIGHSLGCRVILETLELLRSDSTIELPGFLLMAGAVPIDFLVEFGRLQQAACAARRRFCLYSHRDPVLFTAFPPGQILAGEQPLYDLPVATGFTGWPSWLYELRSNTRLGHGGYWNKGIFTDGGTSRDLLTTLFRVATDSEISRYDLLLLPDATRSTIIAERNLPVWNLVAEDWLEQKYGPDAR